MRQTIAAALLFGAGALAGVALARPPVNLPTPKVPARPTPTPAPVARPAPRPSIPTPSRPAQPAPRPAPALPTLPTPQLPRPPVGQKPNLPLPGGGNALPPVSRPTVPKPVTPSLPARPAPQPAPRPTPLPGGLGGLTKPGDRPNLPAIPLPGGNANNRPSVLPGKPDLPITRPGITLPGTRPSVPLPGTKPALPPIGIRPELPSKPERPSISWPSKPDVKPAPLPGVLPKLPALPERPPGIAWPNRPPIGKPAPTLPDRPNVINRPGINLDGSFNTIINNTTNNTVINQITQNNYHGGNKVFANNSRIGSAIYDYHGAWYHNYSYWQRSYHPWYHGCWHGATFPSAWGLGPVGIGIWAWGLNGTAFVFGYHRYVNPFFVAPPAVVVPAALNYSQPIVSVVQALPESGTEPPPVPETASRAFDAALAAFKEGKYRAALDKSEQALKDFPNDPAAHQFRALCLFALGEYQRASAAVHAVLASGPGWDWTTVSGLYPDTDTYVNQLLALEKATAAKPDDPALWFLLAYHYTTAGHEEPARDALARARKLLPADPVVAQLARAAGAPEEKVEPKDPPPKPADIKLDVTGDWTAPRPDGGSIGLSAKADGTFTWSVTEKGGKKESFGGTFSLEDNVMILERSAGGALMGRVTALAANKFQFKVLGGGDSDPGLTFAK
jgi:tetratricopeptide (TPR) repeat protein